MGFLTKNIRLPAVKRVNIVIDDVFIRRCLKKRKADEFEKLNWPEALKAVYREVESAEAKLAHIESVCRKARLECIIPYKDRLWNLILAKSNIKEI